MKPTKLSHLLYNANTPNNGNSSKRDRPLIGAQKAMTARKKIKGQESPALKMEQVVLTSFSKARRVTP